MKGIKILIAEDETVVAASLQSVLVQAGFDVVATVVSGWEAVSTAITSQPDIILMDIGLCQDIDGVEASRQIHAHTDIPIVYLTAGFDRTTLDRVQSTNPYGYILKPFNTEEIQPAIEMALYRYRTDREISESRLQLARYRRIVESQSDFIMGWLPSGMYTYTNESHGRYFSRRAGDITDTVFSLFVPDDQEQLRALVARLTPENPESTGEFRIVRGDGVVRRSQWINRAFFDEQNRLTEMLSIGRDVTEQRQVEEAFRESEKRYRQVVENAVDFIYTTDKNGYFTYGNPAALQLSGYTLEEFRTYRYIDLIRSDYRPRLALMYVRQFKERRPTMYAEFPFITKSGVVEWFGQTSSLIIENDEVIGFHVIGRKITESVMKEQKLVESHNRIHSVLEASPVPLILSNVRSQTTLYANKRTAELFCIPHEQSANKFAPNFYVHPEDREYLRQRALHEGFVRDFEVQLQDYNGRMFWGLLSAQMIDYDGEHALLVACNDITSRKQAEEEIRRLNSTLEERVAHRTEQLLNSNREKDEILAIVAHDLKNPLTGIAMGADLLNRHYHQLPIEEIKKQLGMILQASEHIGHIIANLLDSHKLDSGIIPLEIQHFPLAHVLHSLLQRYVQRAIAKNIGLDIHMREDLFIYADQTAVSQIVDNLISNALKFSPRGSTVRLMAAETDKTVIIEVLDNGPGLDQEDMGKLFTKFARLSAKPTGGEHSTGLGLSIVKKLTDSMNGRIRCVSKPGEGARFIVEFPKNRQAQ